MSQQASHFSRRAFVASTAGAAIVAGSTSVDTKNAAADDSNIARKAIKFCLNTSTIHGEVIPIVEQIAIAKKAGYDSVEIWLRDVDKFTQSGGMLAELRKRIEDAGLTVDSAIAFANWIVDDDTKRAKGLEQAKREMETVVALGGKRIAAPPAGGTNLPVLNLDLRLTSIVWDRYSIMRLPDNHRSSRRTLSICCSRF